MAVCFVSKRDKRATMSSRTLSVCVRGDEWCWTAAAGSVWVAKRLRLASATIALRSAAPRSEGSASRTFARSCSSKLSMKASLARSLIRASLPSGYARLAVIWMSSANADSDSLGWRRRVRSSVRRRARYSIGRKRCRSVERRSL